MAISTYDDLVKSVIKWSHRSNIDLLVPDFIEMCEREMFNNDGTQLEVAEMEEIFNTTTSGKYIDLPAGFRKARSLLLSVGGDLVNVSFQAPSQLTRKASTGIPMFFTVIGDQIEFNVTPDSDYDIQFQYYKEPDAVTKLNQTNVILTNYPSIYLFGALHQAFLHLQDSEQAMMYGLKFQSIIKGANKSNKKARYGATPAMRVNGVTP